MIERISFWSRNCLQITYLKWQLKDDLTGEVGDRLVLIFPIVKVSWAEDKVFNDDASCHMAATRFGKNCSAHAQARAASSVILTNYLRFPVIC